MLGGSSQSPTTAARGGQIVEHSSDNETVNDRSQKIGRATEHSIDGSEKCICRLSPHFIERRSKKETVENF